MKDRERNYLSLYYCIPELIHDLILRYRIIFLFLTNMYSIFVEKITKEQYEYALERVEELLPIVDDTMSSNDKKVIELSVLSDLVIEYEKLHYPIEKPQI